MTIHGISVSEKGVYLSPKWFGGIAAVVVAIIAIAFLVAMSGNSSSAALASQTAPSAAVSVPSQGQAPVVQSSGRPSNQARVGDVVITMLSVKSNLDGLPDLGSRVKYVVIDLSMENVSARNVPDGPTDGFLLDSDGYHNKIWGGAGSNFNRWQPSTPKVGQKSTGTFVFTIPKESKAVAFEFNMADGSTVTIPLP